MAIQTDMDEAPNDAPVAGFGLQSRDVLPVLACLIGAAALFTRQQPTGNIAADVLLTFGFGAGVTWLGARAKPVAVAAAATLALLFTGFEFPAIAFAGGALILAVLFLTRPFDRDSRAIGLAASAGLTVIAALQLPNLAFEPSASILAAVSVLPIIITGVARLEPDSRKRVMRWAMAAALAAVVATVLAVVAALGARDDVEQAITRAEAGVDAVQFGDQPAALVLLEEAEAGFERASNRLSGPMTWPARWVPVAAQHARALETAADQGSALVSTAARTVNQADVDRIRGNNGQIDLATIEAVNAELTVANATVQGAQASLIDVDTPWLLPVLSERLETVRIELAETGADIDLANHATSVMPGILGAIEPRTYVVLFVQPAESREFGGFVGAYGLLDVEQGKFSLVESGSINTDFGFGLADFAELGSYPESFVSATPALNPQNLTATADLPTIARALQELAPQWRQDPDFSVDGVITIDPYALAGILELTGPVFVADRDEPIDATNVVDYLLRDQYSEFEIFERGERQEALNQLAAQAFERLFAIEIPGPERLGAIFGPSARANRLSMITFSDVENAFLDRIFLSADLPQVGSAVDMVGVYSQTGVASKLDAYATRSITYDVVVDPATGQVTGDLVVEDRNLAPADASVYILGESSLPDPDGNDIVSGDNFLAMGLYTRSTVNSFSSSTPFRVEDPTVAFSYQRHPIFYMVPQGGMARIEASLSTQVEPGRYDVFIPAQASANISELTLRVRPVEGWNVAGEGVAADGSWTTTLPLNEAMGFTFLFESAR
jgi:hypothetical protein